MPVKVQIDGIGQVELDDTFATMSPDQQEATISEIVGSYRGQRTQSPPSQPSRPKSPSASPHKDARSVIQQMFPNARVTDWKRDPNSALGRANPSSYHTSTGAAVDTAPIEGMTFEEYVDGLRQAGYPIIEAIDEVKNPSGHATGPHWHVVIGERLPGYEDPTDLESDEGLSGGSVADDFILDEATPETAPMLPSGSGSIFPTMDQWKQGLEIGLGDAVEGLASVPGIVVNPINDLINRAAGTNLSTDLAGDTRRALGLEEGDDPIGSAMRKGAAGGLSMAGAAQALARAVPGVVGSSFAELGSTPVFDTLSGAAAGGSSELAAELGGGPLAQTLAGIAGGGAAFAAGKGYNNLRDPEIRAERFSTKQAETNPYAAYDAEIASDLLRLLRNQQHGHRGKAFSQQLDVKAINNLEQEYAERFMTRVGASGVPKSQQERLKGAWQRRYTMSADEIAELRGTVEGDAFAEAITKAQRLRYLTSREAVGLGNKTALFAADILDWIPGNLAGNKVPQILRKLGRQGGDTAETRVQAATAVTRNREGWRKTAEKVGPSNHGPAKEAFTKATDEALDAPPASRNPLEDLMDQAAERGVKGDGGVRGSFKSRLGVDDDQLDQVLAHLEDKHPDFAKDIKRVRNNLPTRNKKFGQAFRPLMREAMDELGITPKQADGPSVPIKPVDGPAVDDGSAIQVVFGDDGFVTQRAAYPHLYERAIERPEQYQAGTNARQKAADNAIVAMTGDSGISKVSHPIIGRAAEHVRNNIKTQREAMDYFESDIVPTLEIEGVLPEEVSLIRRYFKEIASAKKYKDREDLEKGLYTSTGNQR